MTYSVWNQGAVRFDYYETAEQQREVHTRAPTHLRGGRQLGVTPDEAAWPLPAAAKPVGHGPLALGRIASQNRSGLGAFEWNPGLVKLGLLGLSAFLVWKFVLK